MQELRFWHLHEMQQHVNIRLNRPMQNRKYCPKRHGLSFGNAGNYTFRQCDTCKGRLNSAEKGYSCKPCDFDICKNCAWYHKLIIQIEQYHEDLNLLSVNCGISSIKFSGSLVSTLENHLSSVFVPFKLDFFRLMCSFILLWTVLYN